MADDEEPLEHDPEQARVFRRRFKEAREYGLTLVEARLFAESDMEIRLLRLCAEGGCPPQLGARILT